MKTKRFDFNFRPLQLNVALSVSGSVPDRQDYDGDAGAYTPDYTLTALTIRPSISRMDKEEILTPGEVNAQLTNIRWYEIIGGISTLITVNNASYEVITAGGDAGTIKVKKNAAPGEPITLEFHAEYVDSRTGQIHVIRASHLVKCGNSTRFIPLLLLDVDDQTIYNPLTDTDTQAVHASLRLGAGECPAAKRVFVWEVCRDGSTWTTVGEETTLDYPLTVSADGVTCTVNRKLMGTELYLRCRAKYDADGTNPGAVVLNDAAPAKIVSFVRRIPKYEFDYALPTNIPFGLLQMHPELFIWDTNGPIDNAQDVLLPLWYIGTNQASGTPASYAQVSHGYSPVIPTSHLNNVFGAVVGLDVLDPGPACCWEDNDGAVFTDGDGNVILIN